MRAHGNLGRHPPTPASPESSVDRGGVNAGLPSQGKDGIPLPRAATLRVDARFALGEFVQFLGPGGRDQGRDRMRAPLAVGGVEPEMGVLTAQYESLGAGAHVGKEGVKLCPPGVDGDVAGGEGGLVARVGVIDALQHHLPGSVGGGDDTFGGVSVGSAVVGH